MIDDAKFLRAGFLNPAKVQDLYPAVTGQVFYLVWKNREPENLWMLSPEALEVVWPSFKFQDAMYRKLYSIHAGPMILTKNFTQYIMIMDHPFEGYEQLATSGNFWTLKNALDFWTSQIEDFEEPTETEYDWFIKELWSFRRNQGHYMSEVNKRKRGINGRHI